MYIENISAVKSASKRIVLFFPLYRLKCTTLYLQVQHKTKITIH